MVKRHGIRTKKRRTVAVTISRMKADIHVNCESVRKQPLERTSRSSHQSIMRTGNQSCVLPGRKRHTCMNTADSRYSLVIGTRSSGGRSDSDCVSDVDIPVATGGEGIQRAVSPPPSTFLFPNRK